MSNYHQKNKFFELVFIIIRIRPPNWSPKLRIIIRI